MTDRNATQCAGYHPYISESGEEYGRFEVFFQAGSTEDNDGHAYAQGWYWWPAYPGALPDGEPVGPFPTSRAAYLDARAL